MTHVFQRAADLPVAVKASGCWIVDADGRRYLDACGGAIVNGVGHGRREVIDAIARQLGAVDYVHGHSFTTDVMETYADRLSAVVPVDDGRLFPVSGGSEATETAVKLARAYHLALGDTDRTLVLGRWGSYHGNTLGALDLSGRPGLRAGYEPWLGRFGHLPPVNEYRCPNPQHPDRCGAWHADQLDRTLSEVGAHRVAAFMAEPIAGASIGAAVPPDGYWASIVEVCRSHGVLVIGDEVMTGFGRTGRWFGLDHQGVRADIVTIAKGAASGYWPLGGCVASGHVADVVSDGFHHGYTYSHHPVGAAAGLAVLDLIEREGLVERSARAGMQLIELLRSSFEGHERVGDVRGSGLMVAVEFVEDRSSGAPFPRADRITERVRSDAIAAGVVPYGIAGCADGTQGDGLMLGPPLTIDGTEIEFLVEGIVGAVHRVLG